MTYHRTADNEGGERTLPRTVRGVLRPLCLYAFRFVREMPAAEDIVADIFAALWDRLPEMELRDGTAGGYLTAPSRTAV